MALFAANCSRRNAAKSSFRSCCSESALQSSPLRLDWSSRSSWRHPETPFAERSARCFSPPSHSPTCNHSTAASPIEDFSDNPSPLLSHFIATSVSSVINFNETVSAKSCSLPSLLLFSPTFVQSSASIAHPEALIGSALSTSQPT